MSGAQVGAEFDLITQSVENANTRIKMFRIAFGAAPIGAKTADHEIRDILAALSETGRSAYLWSVEGSVERCDAKLVLLFIQCLETSMPYGGAVRIDRSPRGWEIAGGSDRLRVVDDLWDIAMGRSPVNEVPSEHVQFPMVALELARQNRRLDCRFGTITLAF